MVNRVNFVPTLCFEKFSQWGWANLQQQCANLNNPQKQMVQTWVKPVSSRCSNSTIAASTSMLFLRRLLPKKACLVFLRALVFTADFIHDTRQRKRDKLWNRFNLSVHDAVRSRGRPLGSSSFFVIILQQTCHHQPAARLQPRQLCIP